VNGDHAAVKRLLLDFRARLQALDSDLCRFYAAVDGPPGAVAELADEICDRDWYVDGVDIRDLLPVPTATAASWTAATSTAPWSRH
jgi:hypothetical protein